MLVQPFAACATFQEAFPPKSFGFRSVCLRENEDPSASSPCKSALPGVVLPKTSLRILARSDVAFLELRRPENIN